MGSEVRQFQRLSVSIENLRFPLILFIIMLHSYTSTVSLVAGHSAYFRMVYPLALWLGETGVPAYFFISGLLLFYSRKSYGQKLQSRVKTLLIPYLVFNGLVLLGHLLLLVMGRPAMILDKSIADYGVVDYLRAFWDRGDWAGGNGAPMLCPFWYIRNLMVLVVLSPVLYYVLKYTKLLFPLLMGILWINQHDSAYTLQSLTMFSLGAYFPVCGHNPISVFDKYKYVFLLVFLALGLTDMAHTFVHIPYATRFHRLSLVANVFFLLWIGERLRRRHLYSAFLSKSAFFVFCIHYPLTLGLRPVFSRLGGSPDVLIFGVYVVSVCAISVICVLVYGLLQKTAPRFLNAITGSRS